MPGTLGNGIRRWLGGTLLGVLLATLVTAQEPNGQKPAEPPRQLPETLHLPRVKPTHTSDLARYRQIALERQPTVIAGRTSLCLAQTKIESIHKIGGIASLIRKDLDIRKEQSHYGVLAAQAQLSVAAWETLYGVTRNYWSAVFAQEQLNLADEALDPRREGSLPWLRKLVEDFYEESGRKDLRQWSATTIDVTIESIRAKKIEAEVGLKRAMAAMREAMGVECDFPIHIPQDAKLPWIEVPVCLSEALDHAQNRRGEITQAAVFKEVTELEAKAQGKTHAWSLTAETFASGSDIHVQSVPMQLANGDYRPGGLGPDMPAKLAGPRADRVAQVNLYAERACSVVEKTRKLLALQTEDAVWKYEKATREVTANRKALQVSNELRDKIADEFKPVAPLGSRPNLDDLLGAGLKAAQFRLAVNMARYERLLALTLLERATAGGIDPGFDKPLPLDFPLPNEEKKPAEKKPDEMKDDKDKAARVTRNP